ncbi:MAG: DUF2332 domain-containing protein [Kurthia sp.]|nr:DUF2332 domain-containing protein [Candidatus Kurthia equi]
MKRNLQEIFTRFAENECQNSSKLYEILAQAIATDKELLAVASQIPYEQPAPQLFFASINYLLKDSTDILRQYYPNYTASPLPAEEAFVPFKAFVKKNHLQLAFLFATKLVQTNEVRRCAYLYPMLCEIFQTHQQPLALIEIGASAGLQLGIDHYQFAYGDETVGNESSELTLTSDNRGDSLPESIHLSMQVATRIGMDLRTLNVQEEEDLLWLEALIWPEHEERRQLLKKAASITRELPIQLVDGDATKKLLRIAKNVPQNEMLVIFHTYVANQFTEEAKMNLMRSLIEISKCRPVYHIYNHLYDQQLHQDFLDSDHIEEVRRLEQTDGHAHWFEWKNAF